jgi:glycerophosphoryl diester phosphodiesterase
MSNALTPVQQLAERPFSVSAHRGGDHPQENTPDAFRYTLENGIDWPETDVHYTESGLLVAFHDDNLSRLAGEPLEIKSLDPDTRERLRIDRGLHIPLFSELIELVPAELRNRVVWNIDCKDPESVDPLLELLGEESKRYGYETGMLGNVILSSFNHETIVRIRQGIPDSTATALSQQECLELATGALTSKPAEIVFAQIPVTAKLGDQDNPQLVRLLTPDPDIDAITIARGIGIDIHAWGEPGIDNEAVDTRAGIIRLARLGCRGVFTNKVAMGGKLAADMQACNFDHRQIDQ